MRTAFRRHSRPDQNRAGVVPIFDSGDAAKRTLPRRARGEPNRKDKKSRNGTEGEQSSTKGGVAAGRSPEAPTRLRRTLERCGNSNYPSEQKNWFCTTRRHEPDGWKPFVFVQRFACLRSVQVQAGHR